MFKKIVSVLTAFALVMAVLSFAGTDAQAAGKAVSKSKWKKLTVGGLTKTEVASILNDIVETYGGGKKTMRRAAWDKNIKKDGGVCLTITGTYYCGNEDKNDPWVAALDLKTANKHLSFCSNYRLKENMKKQGSKKRVQFRTDDSLVYYYGGPDWLTEAKITSARYNSKKMIIKFSCCGQNTSKYTATLNKVKSGADKGRYKLVKIVRNKK